MKHNSKLKLSAKFVRKQIEIEEKCNQQHTKQEEMGHSEA